MAELGFYHGEFDSIPGPQLFQAVKDFQASNGLIADGIVGEQTFALLFG
ncbi:peptidoglycan-binding domain-containing protein [Eubacterium callanderi]